MVATKYMRSHMQMCISSHGPARGPSSIVSKLWPITLIIWIGVVMVPVFYVAVIKTTELFSTRKEAAQ